MNRIIILFISAILFFSIFSVITSKSHNASTLVTSMNNTARSVSSSSTTPNKAPEQNVVTWDYKVEERNVGDLVNGDMTLLPENELMPNDDNYATGDKIWVLMSMNGVITTSTDGKNDISLTQWKPIKTYKSQDEAKKDIGSLKESVQTDADLIGVYKTELDGKYREFVVIKLPSGMTIKQPIDENRYAELKDKNRVKVSLEVVHDYTNYDLAFPKFRGWAQ